MNTSNSSLTISGPIDAGSKEACRVMGVATHDKNQSMRRSMRHRGTYAPLSTQLDATKTRIS
jgi:hypothetical protein